MDACTESRILAINLSLAPKIEISVRARCFENPHYCKYQKIFFSWNRSMLFMYNDVHIYYVQTVVLWNVLYITN